MSNRINLTAICERANWHLSTTIGELQKTLSHDDAEAFACFAFADFASYSDTPAEDHVDDAQWDRLQIGADGGWEIVAGASSKESA